MRKSRPFQDKPVPEKCKREFRKLPNSYRGSSQFLLMPGQEDGYARLLRLFLRLLRIRAAHTLIERAQHTQRRATGAGEGDRSGWDAIELCEPLHVAGMEDHANER